ncbi:hypothetical protein PALB_19000 [Pseudoalteromonas luteoviolacea B = ATCC 29581]|nr:hypothetical protein PALB_19000 [Pseudoalteromonas luteoviolacea B = ATCC 29581]
MNVSRINLDKLQMTTQWKPLVEPFGLRQLGIYSVLLTSSRNP